MPLPKSAQDTTREKREDLLVRGASTLDGVNTILGGPLYSTNRFAGVYSSLVSGIARNSFPVNPNARAAFGGSSTPAGGSWAITQAFSSLSFNGVASSSTGSTLYAVALGSPIYKSINSGLNWSPTTSSNLGWASIATSGNGSNVAAVGYETVFVSLNSGTTWSNAYGNLPASNAWKATTWAGDGSVLAVAGGDLLLGDTRIYVTSNYQAGWSAYGPTLDWVGLASSSNGSNMVAVPSNGRIHISTNTGQTWTGVDASRNWTSVASSADGCNLVATVNGGGIYRSSNGGSNWVVTSAPIENWSSITSSADGSVLAAVVLNPTPGVGGLYTSTDSGTTWTARSQLNDWASIASSSNGSNMVASSFSGGLYTIVYG